MPRPALLALLSFLALLAPAAASRPRAVFVPPHGADAGCLAPCRRAGLLPVLHPDAPRGARGELCAIRADDGSLLEGTMRPPATEGGQPTCEAAFHRRGGSPRIAAVPGGFCGCLPPREGDCGDGAAADAAWIAPGERCPEGYLPDPRTICTARGGRTAYFGTEVPSGSGKACGVYWHPNDGRGPYGGAVADYRLLCVPGRFVILGAE